MTVEAVHLAIKLIGDDPQADFEGPRSPEAIAHAQQQLGLSFPASYREFLLKLGVGGVDGFEFFGLCNSDGSPGACGPDVLGATFAESEVDSFSRDLIFISADGMGGSYVIDRSVVDANGESPIRVWERGPGLTEYVADSFGEYFLKEIQAAYEERKERDG